MNRTILIACICAFLMPLLAWEQPVKGAPPSFHCTVSMKGKPVARAFFRLSEDERSIHYKVVVEEGENITMAHLHLGKLRQIGSPVLWLFPPSPPPRMVPGKFEGVLVEGIITAEDLRGPLRNAPLEALVEEMRAGNTYVNIHTADHPGGEICGPVYLREE